ncbi:hypothetical protein KUV57_09290 [Epibacterium sp. DP7N7-1]|nr:hypothetical protein [Epibacterium sp. DP7N7-1]
MYINQSLSEQTLALFKTAGASQDGTEAPKTLLASSSVADQALKFALSKIALAARAGEPAEPVSEGAEAGIPEEGGTYGGRFSDPAQRAKIFAEAYARQAASDAFQAENGYKNRLSMGLYTANSMAKAQQPGMGHYETREDAVAAECLGDMITEARSVNRTRNTTTIPHDRNLDISGTQHNWIGVKNEDAQKYLTELSADELVLAKEKQAHDLKVTGMWYNVRASELTRDFGVTAETSTSFDEDGRVTLNDFEVTHSKYGKVGEVKDGVFYIATTDGTLVDPEVYFGNAAAN